MSTNVALNPHFEQFIRAQIDSGKYDDESEVVRAALRLLEDQQSKQALQLEGLRSAIAAGLQGPGIPADEAFDRLEAKYQAMADHQSV
ncbi:MAG: type II toxin-antitoxin system ParD family antitoxin [Gammaproteobacteria bacterium]|nr:type II toxin-antitoxin system ParD family antitoxin [Gammaproteobacteria bacterium]MBU1483000.1 type II toxin-antitoxin system ParD family antitoxin [Gammaproteobacteria bacterium]